MRLKGHNTILMSPTLEIFSISDWEYWMKCFPVFVVGFFIMLSSPACALQDVSAHSIQIAISDSRSVKSPAFISGAVCTGSDRDDGPRINDFLVRIGKSGSRWAQLPPGVCRISTSVKIPAGVMLVGQGAANFGACGTTLQWRGPIGGDVVTMAVSAGVLVNPGLADICIDGSNIAGRGIVKRGVQHGEFTNIVISGVISRGIFEDVAKKPSFSDQLSHWTNVYVSCSGSGVACWEIGNSDASYDVASNHYDNVVLTPSSGAVGFICGNADGNTFHGLYVLDGGRASSPSFRARRGNSAAITSCRENTFSGETALINGFVAEGGLYPSFGNNILHYKMGDGEPGPVVETGAMLSYVTSYGEGHLNTIIAENAAIGSLNMRGNFLLKTTTVATLPKCDRITSGALLAVTDAKSPAWHRKLVGNGSTFSGAMCDGSNWIAF